jgi:cell wall-associated NlpC family hydrolase
MKAYRHAGYWLPRTTYEMLASRRLVRIPRWQARRGDLAFYGTGHVELFVNYTTSYGAETHSGVGYHHIWPDFHPTKWYRIR